MPPNTKLHPATRVTLTPPEVTIASWIQLTILDLPTGLYLDTAATQKPAVRYQIVLTFRGALDALLAKLEGELVNRIVDLVRLVVCYNRLDRQAMDVSKALQLKCSCSFDCIETSAACL
ncbi:unnamed protein product [Euphydryas editha]|uniref:Uncharacterized protein n=1 Tax=Euphydryas editha TaxID=104508 RepID=A0AAU9V334_EUPED|nr:unnamed protein product [Euphydryas editha]